MRMSSRTAAVVAGLCTLVLALVLLVVSGRGPTPAEALARRPETEVLPPQSVRLAEYSREAEWNPFAPDSATYSRTFGSSAPPDEVAEHYQRELGPSGFGCYQATQQPRELIYATRLDQQNKIDICVWYAMEPRVPEVDVSQYQYVYRVTLWDRDSEPGPPLALLAIVFGALLVVTLVPLLVFGGVLLLIVFLAQRIAARVRRHRRAGG